MPLNDKRLFDSLSGIVIKCFAVTLGTFRSPLTPLKKGGTVVKVSLFKGDLEGSKTFNTYKRTLWLTPRELSNIL